MPYCTEKKGFRENYQKLRQLFPDMLTKVSFVILETNSKARKRVLLLHITPLSLILVEIRTNSGKNSRFFFDCSTADFMLPDKKLFFSKYNLMLGLKFFKWFLAVLLVLHYHLRRLKHLRKILDNLVWFSLRETFSVLFAFVPITTKIIAV